MKFRLLDLFSGIGGFSLGLERSGYFETVQFCEIDPYCRRVLAKHWPKVPCHDDVRTLDASRFVSGIDAICGGFPCQDISVAGNQRGIGDGTRSGLWSEIMRLVSQLRPRYLIMENVANLLVGPSIKPGAWFGRILAGLASIGYDAEWCCIPASAVGAPHRRNRVWIVAYPQRSQFTRQESCFGSLGRMGRIEQSMAWDRDWKDAFTEFRRMDDGIPRSVASTDGYRNAVVPQIPEMIGSLIGEFEASLSSLK